MIDRTNGQQIVTLLTNHALNTQRLRELPAVLGVFTEGMNVRISSSNGTRTVQALVSFLATEEIELIDLHLRRATPFKEAFIGLTQSDRKNEVAESRVNSFIPLLRCSLLLHFRNRLALIYGYLFPAIFLAAFWVLYRHEPVPLIRHLGQLMTVTILGSACFGLPTTIVNERERGMWRRYRLTPVRLGQIVFGTVAARYLIILGAGALQLDPGGHRRHEFASAPAGIFRGIYAGCVRIARGWFDDRDDG